jgi:hypothetical protein
MPRIQPFAVACLLTLAYSPLAYAVPADWCKASDHTSMSFESSNGNRVLAELSRQGDHVAGSVMLIRPDGQVTAHGFTAGDFNSKVFIDGSRYLDLKIHFLSDPGDIELGVLIKHGTGNGTGYGFTGPDQGVTASTFEHCAGWPQEFYVDASGRPGALPAPRYTCEMGYVWREVDAFDRVCVSPEDREVTTRQNRDAHLYTNPGPAGGCIFGHFSRRAVPDDDVCTEYLWSPTANSQNQASHAVNYADEKIDVEAQYDYCDNYGVSASAEAKQNVAMQCGNMGVRWDRSREIQQNWCRTQMLAVGTDQAMLLAKAESDARKNTLLRCKLKNNPGPIVEERAPFQPKPPSRADAIKEHTTTELQCLSGFVWRDAAANDGVCVSPESRGLAVEENRTAGTHRAGANTLNCVSGLVWREAFAKDTVCVTPARRTAVREENRMATQRLIGH